MERVRITARGRETLGESGRERETEREREMAEWPGGSVH